MAGLIEVQLWQVIFTIINVLILFWFLKKFLFVPVQTMMNNRTNEIANSITSGEEKNREADRILAEYSHKISEAQIEGREIIQRASITAEKRAEEIVEQAKDETQKIKDRAYKDIELEKDKAFRSIKTEVADMAVQAAEKLIGKTLDKDTDKNLIDEVINEMGEEKWPN